MTLETSLMDDLDRVIIHALMILPRAPFKAIATVAGVSDQTVARRYRRLEETVGLRVLGTIDTRRTGWVDWYLRLQCTPGSAVAIAEALASRGDTKWVHLASAGTEVDCLVQARSAEARDALFLKGLPGSRHVVQINAYALLHPYSPPTGARYSRALSEDQECALRALDPRPATAEPNGDIRLRPADEVLLARLARDGRSSIAAVAEATNWHESSVRRRIDELVDAQILCFEIDLDTSAYGYDSHSLLWLTVDPAELDAVGRAIAAHQEVPFAAATTGATNLMASVLCRDAAHLYDYLTSRLQNLPGVRAVETVPVIRTLKRHGALRPPKG